MINQDKPTTQNSEHQLSIGGGFFLKIGDLYKLLINPESQSSFVNQAKASIGETWATIPTTWATETRTWLEASKLIENASKPVTSITNVSKP